MKTLIFNLKFRFITAYKLNFHFRIRFQKRVYGKQGLLIRNTVIHMFLPTQYIEVKHILKSHFF